MDLQEIIKGLESFRFAELEELDEYLRAELNSRYYACIEQGLSDIHTIRMYH